MRIEDKYVKTGYFWLPDKDENKIPGTLTIKNGGDIELEVIGLFDGGMKLLNGNDYLNRIIGDVEKDGLVTLDDCFYTERNFSSCGSKSKVYVNRVLSGIAYDENEVVTFNTLSFSVDCLDEWVGISGINVDSGREKGTATISYNSPENIAYSLENGMQLEICFAYTYPGPSNPTEAKITQRAYLKLKSSKLRPFNDFIDIAYKLTNLMCFAIDTTVTLKDLSATSSEIQRDGRDGKKHPIPVKIYYPSIPFSEKVPNKRWHQMLFSYETIKNNAEDVFNKWIHAYESMTPALSLYFSTKNGDQKHLDGKFLALAQGLETYHRSRHDEKLMDSGEFELLLSTIRKNYPKQNLDWLNGRLMHGNEINFRKRLNRIIEPFKDKLGNDTERSKLSRKIVDTRNYFTHYNEKLKDKSAGGRELLNLCQKMEVIFQLHFLRVVGFDDKEINILVENCYPLKRKITEI